MPARSKRYTLDLVSSRAHVTFLFFINVLGMDLCALGLARALQGSWHLAHTSYFGARAPYFGSNETHLKILEAAMKVIPVLANTLLLQHHSEPCLRHADLHMGNIFVSEDNDPDVVGIIDWQFTSVLPRFIQIGWHPFLGPPENYQTGPIQPELPSDFASMDSDDQAFELSQLDRALLTKCYEAALNKAHPGSYSSLLQVHDTLRSLFVLCERTFKDGIVPLRDSLIQLFQNWHRIGLPDGCPIQFLEEEIMSHQKQLVE